MIQRVHTIEHTCLVNEGKKKKKREKALTTFKSSALNGGCFEPPSRFEKARQKGSKRVHVSARGRPSPPFPLSPRGGVAKGGEGRALRGAHPWSFSRGSPTR